MKTINEDTLGARMAHLIRMLRGTSEHMRVDAGELAHYAETRSAASGIKDVATICENLADELAYHESLRTTNA